MLCLCLIVMAYAAMYGVATGLAISAMYLADVCVSCMHQSGIQDGERFIIHLALGELTRCAYCYPMAMDIFYNFS